MVMDYCPGGDLSLYLAQDGRFSETVAQFFIAELVLAIEYIHKKDIVFRDLKPENILIGKDGHIKLADFGLSKAGLKDGETTSSFCGSPAYLSPEMLNNKGVGKQADIYGIGAVLYEMLTGDPPYYSDNIPKMYNQIKEGKLIFPDYINSNAKSLIQQLLKQNPNQRLGVNDINEIKNHFFFQGINWQSLYKKKIKPPILDQDLDEDFHVERRPFIDQDYEKQNYNMNRIPDFSFDESCLSDQI